MYEDARPDQMVAFTFTDCDTRRTLWDDCATALEPIAPPSRPELQPEAVRAAAAAQSSYMYARTRFPPPMSQREYVYARRVWYKADDGGCYCINKACAHPLPPAAGCRTTRVHDFSSGFVIRYVIHATRYTPPLHHGFLLHARPTCLVNRDGFGYCTATTRCPWLCTMHSLLT